MADFTPRLLRVGDDELIAYDHGAHVTQWSRHGLPVVWVSERARYESGAAIRGGVPICWPWFAAGPDGDLSPSHGFLRTARWDLCEQTDDALRWRITHAQTCGGETAQRFPHPFECELSVHLGEELTLALTVRNTAQVSWDCEAALHTYLHVADVEAIRIEGLAGLDYHDKVSNLDLTQHGDLRLSAETDRIYHGADPVTVHDPVLGRDLLLHAQGAAATVVWNPWADKTAAMPDMSDHEWRRMVCVEAGAVGAGRIHLEPGREHTLIQRIGVAQHD